MMQSVYCLSTGQLLCTDWPSRAPQCCCLRERLCHTAAALPARWASRRCCRWVEQQQQQHGVCLAVSACKPVAPQQWYRCAAVTWTRRIQ